MKKLLSFVMLWLIAMPLKAEILCHTPYHQKSFRIEGKKISLYENEEVETPSRAIASVKVRTKKAGTGFVKTLNFEGKKHQIHIENTGHFDEVEDFVTITSPKGHIMTYPLNCKNL